MTATADRKRETQREKGEHDDSDVEPNPFSTLHVSAGAAADDRKHFNSVSIQMDSRA